MYLFFRKKTKNEKKKKRIDTIDSVYTGEYDKHKYLSDIRTKTKRRAI